MKRLVVIAFFGIFLASSSFAYRFICNGLLANGLEREDSCGTDCDEEHAPRWSNPNLSVVVGKKVLPKNISLSDWEKVVQASFAAWEKVAGSALRFVPVEAESKREFGANEKTHELFWITDKEEWREVVGVGELGTLGATLPKYTCGSADKNREIFDADLVLNGMPHVNWQIGCKDEDCIDPQTTLVHELGHWFGLDHPCLLCSTSIMSARAGFDLIEPVFDDMAGIRALYPNGLSTGFGFPCTKNAECADDKICVYDGSVGYCSNLCKVDQDCASNAGCKAYGSSRACMFMGGDNAGGKREQESCDKGPCSEPLICAGALKDEFFCFRPCNNLSDCSLSQECVSIGGLTKLCVSIRQLGQECNGKELCADGLYCLIEGEGPGFCRQPCGGLGMPKIACPPGQTCHQYSLTQKVCLPDELDLNTGSASFDDNIAPDILDRQGVSAPKMSAPGCSGVLGFSNNISFLVLLLLGLGLRLRLR